MIVSFVILTRSSVSFDNFVCSLVAFRARNAGHETHYFVHYNCECIEFMLNLKTLQWHEAQQN